MRQQKGQPPPRPHSADFLEYEAKCKPNQQSPPETENLISQPKCPQRPKSSLDIVNPSDMSVNDGYFYSEERSEFINICLIYIKNYIDLIISFLN